MFRNYLVTIFRHLRKRKLFALINISGLSIGLATLLALSWHTLRAATTNPAEVLSRE